MKKLLMVNWSKNEQDNYFVDRDIHSLAHDDGDTVTLDGYCGVYTFDKLTKNVTLNTGVEERVVSVVGWELCEEENNGILYRRVQ